MISAGEFRNGVTFEQDGQVLQVVEFQHVKPGKDAAFVRTKTKNVITEDEIASLKRFKDDAKEVAEGYECGVTLAKFADVKEGDVYEAFKMEEYRD